MPQPAPHRLAGLTWPEVAERSRSSILAVPVGSTEQHGRHLPVSTDTDIANELCHRLALSRPDVLVAPALPYGSSGEHAAFAGTLSIGAEATEMVLVELGRSADAFAGLLFVSAHGGNAGPVHRATRLLVSEQRNVRAWYLPEVPTPSGATWDAHAGYIETSVLLTLSPDAVRTTEAAPGTVSPIAELMPLMREGGIAAVSDDGVLGDPTGASPAAGAAIIDAWTARLLADVQGWPR